MRVDGFEVGVLGPLEVRRAGASIELPRGRSRALLALLALDAGRTVSTERLVDELWGASPPATVVTALHGLVSGLRKHIEPDRAAGESARLLFTRPPGYLLDIPPERVDAHRFSALVRRAATVPTDERAALLREALSLWRGPALADVVIAGPAIAEATALEELRLAAYEECIDADLALGRHRYLIGEIEALTAEHPFRERLHGQLMLAHYRSGRQTDALGVWRRTRTTLVEQVGVEPGPGLRRLHRAILEQDPVLDLTTADPTGNASDESAREIAARAGELLAAAGSRVYDRHYDAVTAEELFSRAELLLPRDHPRRDDVVDRIPEIYLILGRHGDADARLKRSLVEARHRGDTLRESHLRLERSRIQLIIGPDPISMEEIEAVGTQACKYAREAGDDALVSQACYVLGLIELRRGRVRRMEELARRGLVAAERSGSPRERLASRWWLALALVEGPTPTDDAIAECEELAELGTAQHFGVLTELARLHVTRGAHDIARDHIARAERDLQRRPGMLRPTMFVGQRAAEVEIAAGDPEGAEPHLRAALALADKLGEDDQRAQLAAKLARVLSERGHTREAAELAHRSRRTAPSESATAQVLWRVAMAAVRSASADHVAARELLEEASALIPDELELLAAALETQLAGLPPPTRKHPEHE
jgi:DNA-binding SARP family transcriptional activator